MISIANIGYTYPGASLPALRGVNLRVPEGTVTVIAGESGSGKTTLLRLVAGFLAPAEGSIAIEGERVSECGRIVAPEQRQVGVVFQDFALFPHLTVEANVAFGISRMPRQKRAARVSQCLDLLGINHLSARYPHELSGGQAQRVAIARSLAPSPRIIVMDEPFNNLNVALRHELVPVVAEVLRSTGITAIVVTHDPNEAYELADQMVLLKDGRLQQRGAPSELYEHPATRYVAHFFGPVNEIDPESAIGETLVARAGESGGPPALPVTEYGTMVVRPEQITLTEVGHGLGIATVRSVRFAGDHLVVELVGDWPGTLRAHVGKSDLAVGTTVGIRVGMSRTGVASAAV